MKHLGDVIQLMVTYNCTMNCPRCLQKPFKSRLENGIMTWREFLNIMTLLEDRDVMPRKIVITGGEPTLWPDLKRATEYIKDRNRDVIIEIITNGMHQSAHAYGKADRVCVSNYGSINRIDMLKLKKELGRRFYVSNSCQLSWPFPEDVENTLPAICNCDNPSFVHDHVYVCPIAALYREDAQPIGKYGKDYLASNARTMFYQDRCRQCLVNLQARNKFINPAVLEISGWNTRICYFIQLGRFSGLARRIYRKIKGMR